MNEIRVNIPHTVILKLAEKQPELFIDQALFVLKWETFTQ